MDFSQWDTKNLEVFWSQTAPVPLTLPLEASENHLKCVTALPYLRVDEEKYLSLVGEGSTTYAPQQTSPELQLSIRSLKHRPQAWIRSLGSKAKMRWELSLKWVVACHGAFGHSPGWNQKWHWEWSWPQQSPNNERPEYHPKNTLMWRCQGGKNSQQMSGQSCRWKTF
jgi:hypothetical protein